MTRDDAKFLEVAERTSAEICWRVGSLPRSQQTITLSRDEFGEIAVSFAEAVSLAKCGTRGGGVSCAT